MKPIHDLSGDEFEALVRRAAALPDAPEPLIRAAIDLWPAAPSASLADRARAAARRVLATLSFDSWAAAPLALGVRSLPSDTRQLLFSAQGRDIDLRITPVAGDFALSGQILGPDQGGRIDLVAHGRDVEAAEPARSASLDDLGEFRIESVPPGTYRLTLGVAEEEIELPPIEIGGRRA